MVSFNKAKYDSTTAIFEALPRDINLSQLDILYYDWAAWQTRRYVIWGGIVSMGQCGLEIFETDGKKILRRFFDSFEIELMEIEEISFLEP
jgi:hypothetical protein